MKIKIRRLVQLAISILFVTSILLLAPNHVHTQQVSYPIYTDSFASGWDSLPWGESVIDISASSSSDQGSSIAFQTKAGHVGVKFRSGVPLDVTPYAYLTFAARRELGSHEFYVDIRGDSIAQSYEVALSPPTDTWQVYQIPLEELNAAYAVSVKTVVFSVKGQSGDTLYIDNLGFGGTAPPPTITPTPVPIDYTLTVDAQHYVNPFNKEMRGQALVNWEHAWAKAFVGRVPGLEQAMSEAGVGLLRYAGGMWANWAGWERSPQKTPCTGGCTDRWYPDPTLYSPEYGSQVDTSLAYSFNYGLEELASLSQFAKNIGAEVMIQVNVLNHDPAMWADMVRYTNIENDYNFQYWELSNELDLLKDPDDPSRQALYPDVYAQRVGEYIAAMKAVDPTITIVSGVAAFLPNTEIDGWNEGPMDLSDYITLAYDPNLNPNYQEIDSVTYHWYQTGNQTDLTNILRFRWQQDEFGTPGRYGAFVANGEKDWLHAYSRFFGEVAPRRVDREVLADYPQVTQGITELNFSSQKFDDALNGNHINAIWAADVLGRLAYNGLDYVTWYTGYGTQGYSIIYPDQNKSGCRGDADWGCPNQIFIRPSYYTFYLYNHFFGDQMIATSSPDEAKVSIWGSTDSEEPGKVKLIVPNLSDTIINATIQLTGAQAQSAEIYILSSTNPLDPAPTSNRDPNDPNFASSSQTTLNGISFNAMDVANSASSIVPVRKTVTNNNLAYSLPPFSVTAIVLETDHNGSHQIFTPIAESESTTPVEEADENLGFFGYIQRLFTDLFR